MEGVKIFDDIAHRDGLKATDKLLIGNADSGTLEHVTVQEVVDLVPSSPGGGQANAYAGVVNHHCCRSELYVKLSADIEGGLEGCLLTPGIFGTGDNRVYTSGISPMPTSARMITVQRFDPELEMVVVFFDPYTGAELGNTYNMSGNQWPSVYPVTYGIPTDWPSVMMRTVIRYSNDAPIEPSRIGMLQWTITAGNMLCDWFPSWMENVMPQTNK